MYVEGLRLRQVGKPGDMPMRRHQQMTRGIRVLVHEDERGVAAVHEKRLRRVDRAGRLVAEGTALLLARLRDVLEAPGRPQGLRHAPFLPSAVVVAVDSRRHLLGLRQTHAAARTAEATVGRVADGDTIELAGGRACGSSRSTPRSSGRASATRGLRYTSSSGSFPRPAGGARVGPPARRRRPVRAAPALCPRRCDERERRARATRGGNAVLRARGAWRARRRTARRGGSGTIRGSRDVGLVPGDVERGPPRRRSFRVGRPSHGGRSPGEPRPSARRLWTSSGRWPGPMTLNCVPVAEDDEGGGQ